MGEQRAGRREREALNLNSSRQTTIYDFEVSVRVWLDVRGSNACFGHVGLVRFYFPLRAATFSAWTQQNKTFDKHEKTNRHIYLQTTLYICSYNVVLNVTVQRL